MANEIDAYINESPEPVRKKLRKLRSIILSIAPEAVERISYGMPHYSCKGPLAYFALSKNHIGLYVPPPVIEKLKRELKGYETAKATVRLPLDGDLPEGLIEKLIRTRMKINEMLAEGKRRDAR